MINTPRFLVFLAVSVAMARPLGAQQISWRQYTQSNSDLPAMTIPCIETDQLGRKWIGTAHAGLAVVANNDWEIYNTSNSGIPDNYVNAIAFTSGNSAWIGTGGGGSYGLARFDGATWEAYNSGNSPIPVGNTQAVAVDPAGTVWIGSMFCSGGGLITIKGASWFEFNQTNSELPDLWIRDIESYDNNIWVASYGNGLAQYDGSTWTMYDTSNSGIPSNYIKDLAFGNDGLLWLATQAGLVTFDGTNWEQVNTMESNVVETAPNGDIWVGYDGDGLARLHDGAWTTYNAHNSELAEDYILSIEADDFGEVWVGTMTQGITVLTVEGTGVTPSAVNELASLEVSMFPIPASETLTISARDSDAGDVMFQLFDLVGRIQMDVALTSGINKIDVTGLASGHYTYTLSTDDGRKTAGVIPIN